MAPKKPKKSLSRRLRKWIIVLVAVVLFALTLQPWVIPAIIRWQASSNLADYWEGQLEIDHIEFSFRGPIRLIGLHLKDRQGRPWTDIASVKFTLRDWPSLHPVLTDIEVEGVNLKTYFEGGRCRPPVLPGPEEPSNIDEYLDIQNITVKNISLTTIDDYGPTGIWGGFHFSLRKDNTVYALVLDRRWSEESTKLNLAGTLQPDWKHFNTMLSFNHGFTRDQSAAVLAALDVPAVRSLKAVLYGDVKLTGSLDDLAGVNGQGEVRLRDGTAYADHGVLGRNLQMLCRLEGRKIDIRRLAADVCDGKFRGSFLTTLPDEGKTQYTGLLIADKIDMLKLTTVIAGKDKASTGILTARYAFRGGAGGLDNLKGKGTVFVDNGVMRRAPCIWQIFSHQNFDLLSSSDLNASFRNRGAVFTIESAKLANQLTAIEAEPGGTVDVAKRTVDAYVCVVPLKQLRSILNLPVLDIIGGVTEKLTRLRIRGRWNDPPEKLISKQPVGDIKAATVEFFRGAAKTGGQLNEGVTKTVEDLLKLLNGGDKKQPKR